MVDFKELNETPYYENLNSEKTDKQNNPTQTQSLIPANPQITNDGTDFIYSTPLEKSYILFFLCFFIGIVIAIIVLIYGMYFENKDIIFSSPLPLIFTIVGFILGITVNIQIVINISSALGTIVIIKKKTYWRFNKEKIIQINEVQEVIFQDFEDYFEINFKLSNETEVNGFVRIYQNSYEERRKAIEIIRNALPQRIAFDGDIIRQNRY